MTDQANKYKRVHCYTYTSNAFVNVNDQCRQRHTGAQKISFLHVELFCSTKEVCLLYSTAESIDVEQSYIWVFDMLDIAYLNYIVLDFYTI